MEKFLARFGSRLSAVLSGFDRLVFRGTLLSLMREHGMFFHLERSGVRLLDFKAHVLEISGLVKEAVLAEAREQSRPTQYLASSRVDKEDYARRLLAEQPLQSPSGLICTLSAVEPCMSFEYHRSSDPKARASNVYPASASISTNTGFIPDSAS
jgi:hypothetical protein